MSRDHKAPTVVIVHGAWVDGAGSENSDHTFSGNSDHLPVARPGQKIVGDSVSGEGKDDRHVAQREAFLTRLDPVRAGHSRLFVRDAPAATLKTL